MKENQIQIIAVLWLTIPLSELKYRSAPLHLLFPSFKTTVLPFSFHQLPVILQNSSKANPLHWKSVFYSVFDLVLSTAP
jgi:hypothetical protein